MADWARVKWSEARQVLDVLKTPAADRIGADDVTPSDYFRALRAAGRQVEAIQFLGQALPRLETVAWAARSVRDVRGGGPTSPERAKALRSTLLWIQDASESRRRQAFDAAEACDPTCAERLAALAAYFSGGSIAPENCPALPAPREAAGKFAAGAILVAAAGAADRSAVLEACLDAGAALADRGLEAAAE